MSPARQSPRQALLILDMIADYQFEGWRAALAAARRIAPRIARLKARAAQAGVPVIYVNDSTGKWRSDRQRFIAACASVTARGSDVVRQIAPTDHDLFIFKPRHSGFYATPLAELLSRGKVNELLITGTTSHQCVLFTAVDAYVRDFRIVTPRDCIAAPNAAHTRHALFILQTSMRARTPRSGDVVFGNARISL